MNRSLFYLYSFIRSLVPIYPVYLILFESKALSLSEISLLLAIWTIPPILLELPTGMLADHWNRKYMLVIGSLLHAGCFALWYFSEGFLLFALGFLLWGISEAFTSGSKEGLLYDSLKKDGKEAEFDKVYGHSEFLTSISTGLSMLSGGFLAMFFGMKTVLLISVGTSLIGAFVVSLLTEVNFFRERLSEETEEKAGFSQTLKDGTSFLVKNWENLLLVAISILVVGTAGIIDEYDQLIAAGGYGFNLTWIGIWGSFRLLLEAFGSKLAYRFRSLFGRLGFKHPFSVIWVLSLLSSLCLLISGWTGSFWLMPLYGLFYLVMASCGILQEEYLQNRIEEQGRATVHSMVSLLYNGYGFGFFGIFSLIMPFLKVFDIMWITALYMLMLLAVFGTYYRQKKRTATT